MANELDTPLTPHRLRAKPVRPWARLLLLVPLAVLALAGALLGWRQSGPATPPPPSDRIAQAAPAPVQPPLASDSIVVLEPATPTSIIPAGAVSIAVPDHLPSELAPAALLAELGEETPVGVIPRVSPAGETPFSAYARASLAPIEGGPPLIAIVVTGLGLNPAGTATAIASLPDNVTLAFAPYGEGLAEGVALARNEGHEIMLEVPLEPFDYPATDPGPETLLTGAAGRANGDRLTWLMARFGGYFAVVNHMGARFTASSADFAPVMEELGRRGLGYLDDGSSGRSVAGQLAAASRVPFGRASLQLDADPSRGGVLAALDRLAALALSQGTAIGIAAALPVSVEAIAEWSAGLADKPYRLVPASALMQKPQP